MKMADLLCSSCRKIHPVESNPDKKTLEEIFPYEIPPNPMAKMLIFSSLRAFLLTEGGCLRCIDLIERYI
jgi:hypothetical protein